MNVSKSLFVGALIVLGGSVSSTAAADSAQAAPAAVRNGEHDFDFNLGVWKSHVKRRLHPLTGSNDFIELNGTVTVRKVWDGRAQLEEIEADGPNGHWEGLTLFLYNPKSHQWSQTFAGSESGTLSGSVIGSFKDGRGELFAQDTLDGRSILVRDMWFDITSATHRFEESYSDDGGKTWEVVFSAELTKTSS